MSDYISIPMNYREVPVSAKELFPNFSQQEADKILIEMGEKLNEQIQSLSPELSIRYFNIYHSENNPNHDLGFFRIVKQ